MDRVTGTSHVPIAAGAGRNVMRLILGARVAPIPVDLAAVATRVVLAWIFVYYGAGKLFAAFGGPGIHQESLYFDNVAHLHPGALFAVLAGVIEFGGGIAVGAGLAARLAGLALAADMVMAMVTVTWSTGINSATSPPGYQLNLALVGLALVVTLLGAGRMSVDAVLAKRLGMLGVAPRN